MRLANVVDKFGVEGGIDAFIAEAAKNGITIPSEHLEKEVKARGRPKSASPRAKIATSDTGSGSETETDNEEYQAKKQEQRKKVTKTADAADAAPKKRGRPAKAKEAAPEPKDDLIQGLVASAKKSAAAAIVSPVTSPELSEDDMTPSVVVAAAPAPAKKVTAKTTRKVVEIDGQKFWMEQFNGKQIIVSCEDNSAFNTEDGEYLGVWDNKVKTVIVDDETDEE